VGSLELQEGGGSLVAGTRGTAPVFLLKNTTTRIMLMLRKGRDVLASGVASLIVEGGRWSTMRQTTGRNILKTDGTNLSSTRLVNQDGRQKSTKTIGLGWLGSMVAWDGWPRCGDGGGQDQRVIGGTQVILQIAPPYKICLAFKRGTSDRRPKK